MKISHLDHLVLTVANVPASLDFYVRVLGMEPLRFGEGRCGLGFGHQKINLHPAEGGIEPRARRPMPGSADLCFLTATPLAEVVLHLQQCGVDVLVGPVPRTGATGSIVSVYFFDPDGNLIEVARPASA